MTSRRRTHTLAQPTLTGGDGRDQLTPCEHDVAVRRDVRQVTGTYPPSPFDVLTDKATGPNYRQAVEEARAMCGRCPIMAACHRANADEDWCKAVRGVTLSTGEPKRSTVSEARRTVQDRRDAMRLDTLRTLVAEGTTPDRAAAWLGLSLKGIYKMCARRDALDLWTELTRSEVAA